MSQAGMLELGARQDVETLTPDAGGAVGPDASGNVNVVGGTYVTTTGNPGTNTITWDVAGLLATLTGDAGGAVSGDGSDNITIVGGDNITTTGNPGANTLTIDATGLLETLTGSSGGGAVSGDGSNNITLTAGTNMTITGNPGANEITFDAAGGGGLTWNEETGTSAGMDVNNGYIANNAALVTLTLPAVAAIGDSVRVTGKGAGGWRIAQNAGQTIYFGTAATTTGVGGRLDSTETRDGIELVCITANTDWNVLSSIGNIDVT